MPVIEIRDVWFSYRPDLEPALRGVSLTFERRTSVAVIGRNGGGKTTLMKHLNGLLRPTRGSVLLDGKDIAGRSVASIAHQVALSFQNPDDQLFSRSVRAEVAFGPRNLGLPEDRIERNVEHALGLLDLSDVAEVNPADLSFSLRKRVAVASAVAMDTDVLVLDEPTTGQDARGVELLERLVADRLAEGKTVITVTHDMDFVARNFERVIVISGGVVRADGTPEAVFSEEGALREAEVEAPLPLRLARGLGWSHCPLTQEAFIQQLADETRASGA